jgi:Fe-S cluster biogenesis protein NfuA
MFEDASDWTTRVRSVVDLLVSPLRADGADVVVADCDQGAALLSVRYVEGPCASCVMSAADLARLLEEGLRAAIGTEVRVQVEGQAAPATSERA